MQTKDGSKDSCHGEASISLISTKLFAEGPIKKNKASFIISARRSYLDLLVTPFLPEDNKAGYYFYDINAKINADLSRKDKLILSTFLSRDKFSLRYHDGDYQQRTKIKWGTALMNLKWNHQFTEKLFATTSFVFQDFKLGAIEHYSDIEQYKKQSYRYYKDIDNATSIRDISFRYDLEYKYSPSHDIKAGFISTWHRFAPVASEYIYATDTSQSKETKEGALPQTEAVESGIYLEDTYKPHARIVLNAGLRVTQFAYNSKSYTNPEPRISLIVHVHPKVSIKGSWAIMNQYIHLLNQYTVGPPVDMWIPATGKLKPMKSRQLSTGLLWEPNRKVFFQLEGYYKKNGNLIDYKTGTSYIDIEDVRDGKSWEKIVNIGKGWAYGTEFSANKSKGKFTGFLSYTLSWNFVQFDSINKGKKFYARYDRRHDLSMAIFYKLTSKIKLSALWVYATGNPITLPVGMYHVPRGSVTSQNTDHIDPFYGYNTLYSERNGYRIPSYHRLDLGVQFHKKKKHWEGTWEVNIYNVYNRLNIYYYFIVQKGTAPNLYYDDKPYGYYELKKLTLFPFLPSISYKISF